MSAREDAAVALADTLLMHLGHEPGTPAEIDVCPLCGGREDGGHVEDWGDGAGCPVLVYLDALDEDAGVADGAVHGRAQLDL